MTEPTIEDDFRMGFMLDQEHTTKLMRLTAISGEAPEQIVSGAIDRIWYMITNEVS